MAIACFDGEADQRSGAGRAKRTPNPHRAAVGIDRTAPSNCRAGAQPNSAPLLPPLRSPILDLVLTLVASMARQPDDRPAGDRLALASWRLVNALAISSAGALARRASEGFQEVRHLIVRMARENFLWGAPRIHGELLMLGFSVSQATVSRYLPAPGRRPTQSWRTFLRNQAVVCGHREYAEERSRRDAGLHGQSWWAQLK